MLGRGRLVCLWRLPSFLLLAFVVVVVVDNGIVLSHGGTIHGGETSSNLELGSPKPRKMNFIL
jgi:hypothetical protein